MSSDPIEKSSMSDFEILKQLGKGAFGSVFLVKRKADNNIYALKSVIMDKLKKKEQENSLNEVRILASIRHPNIIGYKEAFWDEKTQSINIVMEYANEGDLQHKIEQYKKENRFFEENIIWSYSIQMVEGLKALHDEKIMHRDLKSANIFLFNNKICKLGDLNVSKVVKNKMLYTQTGTPYYASPEVWKDKPYSYKSDLWSIGCVIYELCNFRPPFRGRNMDELFSKVCKGETERINKIYSDDLWEMIKMLLRVDPNKRPSCEQFLNCKLIKKKMMEIEGEFDRNVNFNGSNNVLLNSIKINNIREISKKLPKMKNYSNADSMQDYFNEEEGKGSFKGNNSQNNGSRNSENVQKIKNDTKKRPQTGKNIRKNYVLEEPKNKINIKIVKNNNHHQNNNNNNYNNIQQNYNNNQNNNNNHINQNSNNSNNKNNNNNHIIQNSNINKNDNNKINKNSNNNNQMKKGSGSHKNIRKQENKSNNEKKERARTPLLNNHNRYNIENRMIKKPIHINIINNNNKYERHTTDDNRNRRRELEHDSKRVLNTEKKIPQRQNIRPLSSNLTNNRKVIKPMNINKEKGKKTQNVKVQRPLSSNPNIQKKYNTNIEHQKKIINHNYPINNNNNKIKKRPVSSNPISSNNKNIHLKNNNIKKDNYNSRDKKILNDPDVRMMMGPYKVRENNKMKGNFNMNSAIISNNQNGFLKRNIHPVNVININNNVDNNTNNIIINNPKMQQPIINNYYSINTNNQSNAPVKVINVYNQN